MTRKTAASRGMKKYYTGRPCNRGHLTLRYVNTGACCSCIAGYTREYRAALRPQRHKTHSIVVDLIDVEDITLLVAYAKALNFQRELEKSS